MGDRRAAAPPRGRPSAPQPTIAAPTEDLTVMYGHVRRDLRRIAVLAVVLFAVIYASQYVTP
jgi:hypothetical protein